MRNDFFFLYLISVLIFGLSLFLDFFIINMVYVRHKKKTGIEVDYRKKAVIFAWTSKIIAFAVTWYLEVFNSGYYVFGVGVFQTILAPLSIKIIGVVVAMIFILLCDYFIAFRRVSYGWLKVSNSQKITLSVLFAILNAPFLFLIEHWIFW